MLIIVYNMITCFEQNITIWACNWFIGKESLFIFASRNVIDYEFDNIYTYSIGMTKVFEL